MRGGRADETRGTDLTDGGEDGIPAAGQYLAPAVSECVTYANEMPLPS